MNYGVQMYSVRDFERFDFEYTLSRLNEFGYTFFEMDNFYEYTPAEIKEYANKYGFRCCSIHANVDTLQNEFDRVIDFCNVLGVTDVVVGSHEVYNDTFLNQWVEEANYFIPKLKEKGIRLHYHTHGGDYKINHDGSLPIQVLEEKTELFFEVDTYWVYFQGKDPVEELKRIADRVTLIHLKDGLKDGSPKSLGEGTAPVREVLDYATKKGLTIIVESEGQIPDGISEIKRCYKYLKKYDAGTLDE